jgi:hypothetical protein
MAEKKILLLRTCKKDFKKLVNKELTKRYLEVKKYWETRVLEKDWTPKTFDEVHIKNWYSSDSPEIILEFKANNWIVEYEWKQCFKIELWNILEIKNI